MTIDMRDKLAAQIIQSVVERPEDWYVGNYEAHNPRFELCIWISNGAHFVSVKHKSLKIIDDAFGVWPIPVKLWRYRMLREFKNLRRRRGGPQKGWFGEEHRKSVYIC